MFVGIATSDVAILKMFGIGLALAVLVDAFLIRPRSSRRSCGSRAAPTGGRRGRSRRWHLRYGIWENEPIALDREFEARV